MTTRTRHDVSAVSPQDSYAAKRCPVRIQNDVLRPSEPLANISAESLMRMADGVRFEQSIFDEMRMSARSDWVFIPASAGRAEAVDATVAAMAAGAALIAGGSLPVDRAGRRTGKPDLLIRFDGGYVPVDVKNHLTLDAVEVGSAVVSSLSTPTVPEPREGVERRKHKGDALQLAHYRRMLEVCGFASSSMRAGIVGTERKITWYQLDEKMWQTPAKSDGKKRKSRTTMEIYDFEFGFRLDIAAVAGQSLTRPGVDLLVQPVRNRDCPECPWVQHCDLTLTAGSGDPSLLPSVQFKEWQLLRSHGITDRAGVARLSYQTARLLTSKAELETAINLDPATKAFGRVAFLADAIIEARAATGSLPVYRLPGREGTGVPRADIEIDVDMENVSAGVYLWGCLVTDRANTGIVQPGYLPFYTFDPIDAAGEVEVFRTFWNWLASLLERATSAGVSINAYCWYASAENTQMRRISAAEPQLAAAVAEFVASARWIDMHQIFNETWINGASTGLKTIAPLAGYSWSVEDPGGGSSMVKHVDATVLAGDDAKRQAARQWLLNYNRGDVEATWRVREWLDREGSTLPEVSSD